MSEEQPMAFPGMEYDDTAGQRYHYGMELRDWFAGQALQGLLSHDENSYSTSQWVFSDFAKYSYELADAMMEARKHD